MILAIEGSEVGTAVKYSPDGSRIASVGVDSVTIWNATTGRKLLDLDADMRGIGVDFSPDGRLVAMCGVKDNSSTCVIKIWDLRTGLELLTLEGDTCRYSTPTLAFSADGKHLAVSSDGGIIIWGP